MTELDELKNFACRLALSVQPMIIKAQAEKNFKTQVKKDASPVTDIDRAAEKIIRAKIEKRYPKHAILGEEYGKKELTSATYTWVIDPIDGTKSFVAGVPLFGTLLALLREGKPILGIINLPMQKELFCGDGKSAQLNGKPIHVAAETKLSEALLLTTDLNDVARLQNEENFSTLRKKSKLFRTWGDCFGYTLVARGVPCVMCDPEMNPWDLLPLIPVIEGAGGKITSWEGKPAATAHDSLAAAPKLHAAAKKILTAKS